MSVPPGAVTCVAVIVHIVYILSVALCGRHIVLLRALPAKQPPSALVPSLQYMRT